MDFLDLQANWRPPAELMRSYPREVRLTGRGMATAVMGVLLAGAAVAAFVVLERSAARQAERQRELREQGVEAEATVTRLWRAGDEDKTHMVAYAFAYQGRSFRGRSSVPSRIWSTLTMGGPLAVRFLPSDPGRNQPRDWKPSLTPPWLGAMVAPFPLLGSVVIGFTMSRQKRLLAEGQPVPGVVTRHSRADHGQRYLVYEFAVRKGGTPIRGKGCRERHPPPIGEVICVLYDRDNPKRSTRYPLPLYRLA